MVEIHLDEGAEFPVLETLSDGLTRLVMSPEMPLESALHLCGEQISEDVGQQFRSLFAARETVREFELVNGKLVVRPAAQA